ncbi:MAG: EF-P beta-lysylation protein EpmB [Xanthomonadales bacterium]|nr:EF-P beta-lysylation protein EpmB [Xanthomonadales bacterium]
MIAASPAHPQPTDRQPTDSQPSDWRRLWREAITDPAELLDRLGLAAHAARLLPGADTGFPVRVPAGFLARMRPGDPDDPLLLQVLPRAAELLEAPGFVEDAVGDHAARAAAGVIHKYAGRALLVATGACAVHCRYCFRRHFPYARELAAREDWREAVAWIAGQPDVHEVILSGGDPLSLPTARLASLTRQLAGIGHVRALRLHTRLPIVLPERVDGEFLAWLAAVPWPVAVVVHANHGNEIDAATAGALAALRRAGATVLNQSVLLRGVNDQVEALADLSRRLYAAGTLPYYLHLLDRVRGASHFEVDEARARSLHADLRARLPGYLVPRLVREIAGEPGKTPV